MALNGLDSKQVEDAFQTALKEPAGWFLLHYTSRDAIAVLAHGCAGAEEVKNTIAKYTESSPLYGLLMWRGNRVLCKYIPAETSRLLLGKSASWRRTSYGTD